MGFDFSYGSQIMHIFLKYNSSGQYHCYVKKMVLRETKYNHLDPGSPNK